MSYQDFKNGCNGYRSGTPDANSNESYRRGVFQAQDDARNAELNDYIIKGGLNGSRSGGGSPTAVQKLFSNVFIAIVFSVVLGLMLLVGITFFYVLF